MDAAVKEKLAPDAPSGEERHLPVRVGCGKGYLFFKRVMDILSAVAVFVVLLIPMIIVSIVIRIDSKGPAIFKQKRMGRNGKVFVMYKFRTMTVDAPSEVASRDLQRPEQYMTGIGAFLRRTSIDELPQLINIIKGDMSVIGYRPVCLTEEKLNRLRDEYGVFALRPGITGLAQTSGRDNLGYQEKARLDAQYVSTCCLKTDVMCLINTFRIVISGEGVN